MRADTSDHQDQPGRFSRRQKRELLELTAAGVLSAIFVASPIFVNLQPARSVTTAPAAATQAAPASATHEALLPGRAEVAGAVPAGVQVRTTEITAPVSAPALEPSSAVLRAVRFAPPPRRRASAVAALHARVPLAAGSRGFSPATAATPCSRSRPCQGPIASP